MARRTEADIVKRFLDVEAEAIDPEDDSDIFDESGKDEAPFSERLRLMHDF